MSLLIHSSLALNRISPARPPSSLARLKCIHPNRSVNKCKEQTLSSPTHIMQISIYPIQLVCTRLFSCNQSEPNWLREHCRGREVLKTQI